MKKFLIIFLAGLLPAILCTNPAPAQGNSVAPSFDASKSATAAPLSNAHFRAMKDFKRSYKSANDAQWRQISDGFIADFSLNGIKTRSAYSKSGTWVYTIKYYGEKDLPKDVRTIVKSTYFDFSILQVEEVQTMDNHVYLVHIQDGKSWKIARVADGEMDIYKEGQNQ